jgi:hypothetical protein
VASSVTGRQVTIVTLGWKNLRVDEGEREKVLQANGVTLVASSYHVIASLLSGNQISAIIHSKSAPWEAHVLWNS